MFTACTKHPGRGTVGIGLKWKCGCFYNLGRTACEYCCIIYQTKIAEVHIKQIKVERKTERNFNIGCIPSEYISNGVTKKYNIGSNIRVYF